ncbi:hypothetical protein IQ243_18150 [Nostocales cyanobacterium LEGE 11386]|nr:hypothetical protein [Nostocales cyanobacterium LEGE 11386]
MLASSMMTLAEAKPTVSFANALHTTKFYQERSLLTPGVRLVRNLR